MPKSAHDHLLGALDDLEEADLKRFKTKLNQFPVKKGYENIPKGRLEKADTLDVAERLLSFYGEEYAEEVAIAVLEEINCKRQAEKLASLAGTSGRSHPEALMPSASSTSGRNGEHFIDHYREELIQRAGSIDQVLDCLYGKVLTAEQYGKIRAQETNQEKMRELYYKVMPSWDSNCKDQLYAALKAKNPYLIEELEGKDHKK